MLSDRKVLPITSSHTISGRVSRGNFHGKWLGEAVYVMEFTRESCLGVLVGLVAGGFTWRMTSSNAVRMSSVETSFLRKVMVTEALDVENRC